MSASTGKSRPASPGSMARMLWSRLIWPVVAVELSGSGADAAEAKDDVFAPSRQLREDHAQGPQQVVDLLIADRHSVGIVGRDVGGAQQDAVLQREEEHDASVGVSKKSSWPAQARCSSSCASTRCAPFVPPIQRVA